MTNKSPPSNFAVSIHCEDFPPARVYHEQVAVMRRNAHGLEGGQWKTIAAAV